MLDNEIFDTIIPIVRGGLESQGFEGVRVLQNFQPKNEGPISDPCVYIHKVGPDLPYGQPTRTNKIQTFYKSMTWQGGSNNFSQQAEQLIAQPGEIIQMVNITNQIVVSRFQFMSRVLQDPSNLSYTAADLINMVRLVFLQSTTLSALNSVGLQIFKPSETVNPYTPDDRNQYEASSAFTMQITHNQSISSLQNVISSFKQIIRGV
jgi:hypothetical protein